MISEKAFSAICYLVLMDHHGNGMQEAHPSYVEEKLSMLNSGWDAYGYLDRPNQIKVLSYLTNWRVDLPSKIAEYEKELFNY